MKKRNAGLLSALAMASAMVFTGSVTPLFAANTDDCDYCEEGYSDNLRELYSKARTVTGTYYCEEEGHVGGMVQLKLGKINAKTGAVKVTGTLTPFFPGALKGTATATFYDDGEGNLCGTLPFRYKGAKEAQYVETVIFGEIYEDERGKEAVYIGFDGGDEYINIFSIETGTMEPDTLWFSADMDMEELYFDDCFYAVAALGEAPITVSKGTKWSFEKVPSVKYVKYSEDGETWYELAGLEDESKPNVCGLKLSYTSKTGTFKGSYYIYLTNAECIDECAKPTLKKQKVSVTGVVDIYGRGYGSATMKYGRETYSWPINIYPAEDEYDDYE